MYRYIQFDILAIENLKLGRFERDANNWYSHSYIPGSVIKGAIVWNLVQKNGAVNSKILNGDTIFYNAYPLVDGKVTIPMILGYVGDKQEIRSHKADVRLYHSFIGEIHENTIPYNNYEFVIFDNGKNYFYGYNTKLIEKLHINKKDAKDGNKTLMFRYEAVQKGQKFRAFIKVDEEFADEIFCILNEKVLYFGGARGSGYGKCGLSNIKYISSVDNFDSDTDIENDLYIYFLSDAILYFNGKVNTYLPTEVVKERLGIKGNCEFVSSFINLDKAATYNNMYHTNTICYTSITKGSILKYRINEKIDPEKIKEFVSNGVGLRKEDGYGQVAVLGKIPEKIFISGYAENSVTCSANNIVINDEDRNAICDIIKKIFYNKSTVKIEKLVINLVMEQKKPEDNVQTQIGKILNLFQISVYKTEAEFKQELTTYLKHMESKREKKAWHKLRKISFLYNNKSIDLQKLLMDFIEGGSNAIFDTLKSIVGDGIKLGEYIYPEKTEHEDVIYHLQQKFLTNLFEQFLRIKG